MATYYCLPAKSSPRTTTKTTTTITKTKTPIVGIYAIIGLVLVLIQTALVVQVDALAFARPHQQRACAAASRTTTSLNLQVARVAYQGEPGAYSEKSTREHLGNNVIAIGKPNVEACFLAVASMEADYCCLPIECSLGGSIHENYDLMLRYDLTICAEHESRIQHCVLAKEGVVLPGCSRVDANGKTTVAKYAISHPQALAECDTYLRRFGLTSIPTYDTAGSAKMIRDDDLPNRCTPENTIAIASDLAGTTYGMNCLAKGVGNDDSNVTRFRLLGRRVVLEYLNNKVIPSKNSVVFTLPNTNGSLYASNKLKAEKEVVLAAVKKDGMALEFESNEMKAEKEVVLAAVNQNGMALKNASNKMKADKDVVLAAVKKDGMALESASNEMKADKEVVLAAVKQNVLALKNASNKMKADKDVVLAAFKQNGPALQSDEMKADNYKEVILAAVKQDGYDLQYASNELKADRDIVLAALKQIDDTLKSDSEKLLGDRKAALALVVPGNTNATAVRLEQQVKMNLIQHQLASKYFSYRQSWLVTVPPVLAMFLAIVAASEFVDESQKNMVAVIVALISAVAVFLQTMNGVCDYDTRAEEHNSAVKSLRFLREDLGMLKDGPSKGDTFELILTRYRECLTGCKSTVPIALSDSFQGLDDGLMPLLSEKNQLYVESSIYFQACNILKDEISNSFFFPMFMCDSKKVVIATMKYLKEKENVAENEDSEV